MKKLLLATLIMAMIASMTACATKVETEDKTEDVTIDDGNSEESSDNVTEEEVTEDGATEEDATEEDATEEVTEEDATEEDTSDESAEEDVTAGLDAIIDEIYAATGLEFPRLMKSPVTKENQAYMLGVDTFDFVEAVASEPMMTAQAHSLVLFTVEEGADIEAIKNDVKNNVDGRKWICVAVEEENIIVDSVGNMIILIMDDNSAALHDAFLSVVQ